MLGSVVNEEGGTISGVRYGVLAVSGASVTNAGTISGGEIGVVIGRPASSGQAGALVHSGQIDGGVEIEVDSATATHSGPTTSDTGAAAHTLGPYNSSHTG